MSTIAPWVNALEHLRDTGWRYDQIAPAIGASSRSVRRWDRLRVRLQRGGHAVPTLEAQPLSAFAHRLVELANEKAPAPA